MTNNGLLKKHVNSLTLFGLGLTTGVLATEQNRFSFPWLTLSIATILLLAFGFVELCSNKEGY